MAYSSDSFRDFAMEREGGSRAVRVVVTDPIGIRPSFAGSRTEQMLESLLIKVTDLSQGSISISWDVMAHCLRRLLSTGGSWVRLPLWPSRRDLGQVLYLQLPVRFGVKLRYSIRAVVGSASEW